jgi:hypothetical protein
MVGIEKETSDFASRYVFALNSVVSQASHFRDLVVLVGVITLVE